MAYNIFAAEFSTIYKLYLNKVEIKGRLKLELDAVICWLTGYSQVQLEQFLNNKASVQDFIDGFPKLNDNATLIKGSICGHKIEEIQDADMKKVRYLDKLVDELAKGRPLDKIMRK